MGTSSNALLIDEFFWHGLRQLRTPTHFIICKLRFSVRRFLATKRKLLLIEAP